MSLLGNLLGKAVQKGISELTSKINAATGQPQQQNPFSQRTEPRQSVYEAEPPANVPAHFRSILRSDFPQFTVRENVPVTELVGDACDSFQLYKTRPYQAYKAEWGQPYSFVLYQAGRPRAVVMLGGGHTHSANVKYLIARKYAQKAGLPYINFYSQMPNERQYVVSRIKKFL